MSLTGGKPEGGGRKMTTKVYKQGVCPKCGSEAMDYGNGRNTRHDDNCIGYIFNCERCKFKGVEWYAQEFTEFSDIDGNSIK